MYVDIFKTLVQNAKGKLFNYTNTYSLTEYKLNRKSTALKEMGVSWNRHKIGHCNIKSDAVASPQSAHLHTSETVTFFWTKNICIFSPVRIRCALCMIRMRFHSKMKYCAKEWKWWMYNGSTLCSFPINESQQTHYNVQHCVRINFF